MIIEYKNKKSRALDTSINLDYNDYITLSLFGGII